jgi:3-keto-5-aminohexanoate cleavage enzyme
MSLLAIAMGGHVRVGMEDGIYLRQGELAPSNAAFVERMAAIAHAAERDVASPSEARQMLGLRPSV